MSDGRATVLRSTPKPSEDVRSTPTVLRAPAFDAPPFIVPPAEEAASPRSVAQPSPEMVVDFDPELARWVADQIEHERDIAYADGRAAGRADAEAQIHALARGLQHAIDEVRDLTTTHRAHFTDEVMSLAEAIATAVLDRTPHDDGQALLDRICTELAATPSASAVVTVNPTDLSMVAAALTDDHVDVSVDASLGPGEAVISTEWSTVERTRSAAWAAIREAVGQLD